MIDVFSAEERSRIMSRIRGYDTKPELRVRSILHRLGYRFRVQQNKLPGNPDIVLSRHKKVIFVHGCFWHGHKNCPRAKRPATNIGFWQNKLDKNLDRDNRQRKELAVLGWKSLVLWQCQINDESYVKRVLEWFMKKPSQRKTR